MKRHTVLVFIAIFTCVGSSSAVNITWQSDSGVSQGVDRQSDGVQPIDSSFTFALGQFGNFTPSADNVSSWAANWTEFASTSYQSGSSRFTSVDDLANNSIFTQGGQAYIWGYNQLSGLEAEWILMRADEWRWPQAPGGIIPIQTVFLVAQATGEEVVFGTANTDGFQMRTARPFALNYDDWVLQTFSETERLTPGVTGRFDDPDSDGRNNLLEFAAGTNPTQIDSSRFVTIEIQDAQVLVTVNRVENTALSFALLSSGDMQGPFSSPVGRPFLTLEEPARLVYTLPLLEGERSFFRIAVSESQ